MRIWGFAVGAVLAAGCRFPAPVPGETKLAAKRVDVPLRLERGEVLVSARLNGRGPYEFGIDTGSSVTLISSRVAEELGLKKRRFYGVLRGIAQSRLRTLHSADIDELELEGAVYRDIEVLIYDIHGVDGILGFGHFAGSVMTLDFPNRTLTLREGALSEDGARPYRASDSRPVIPVRLGERELRCLIDTGHDGYLVVDRRGGGVAFESPPVDFWLRGIQGSRIVKAGRSPETLRIGSHVIPHPIVVVGFGDNLGLEILRHFSITFDQQNRLVRFDRDGGPIRLAPLKGYAFTRNANGIVSHVVPGSGAEAAGLRVGDRIVSTSGSLTSDGRPDTITLEVRRPGAKEPLRVQVPLEPVIR